jgi:hypothetical protein
MLIAICDKLRRSNKYGCICSFQLCAFRLPTTLGQGCRHCGSKRRPYDMGQTLEHRPTWGPAKWRPLQDLHPKVRKPQTAVCASLLAWQFVFRSPLVENVRDKHQDQCGQGGSNHSAHGHTAQLRVHVRDFQPLEKSACGHIPTDNSGIGQFSQ